MSLISIIVPMHNEQENIKSCIKTLKNQKNQNFDVVFVDDGSTDHTLRVIKDHLALGVSFNYKVFEQENKGAAQARRLGIENASTEFILFLDCDDSLSEDMISEIYKIYHNNLGVDIVIPEMLIENKNKFWNKLCFYTLDNELDPIECIVNSLNGWHVHGCFAIRKEIIKKSYIDYEKYNINNDNYINNDEVITRLNFFNSEKIIRISSVYYYHYNFLSTTQKVNDNHYLMLRNAFILNDIFLDQPKIYASTKDNIVYVLWSTYSYMRKHKTELRNKADWKKAIIEGMSKINYSGLFSTIKFTRKIRLIFFRITNLL